jgi:hypothetical protein
MIRTILMIALASAGLTACQSMPWQNSSASPQPPVELLDDTAGVEAPPVQDPGLPLGVEQRFKDVPLPSDVREDQNRSYVYESSTLQIGRMVYTSKASVNELAQFYIKECPAADWKLKSVLQAEGTQLIFLKPGKRLEVFIKPQGVGRSQLLVLNLTPDGGDSPS